MTKTSLPRRLHLTDYCGLTDLGLILSLLVGAAVIVTVLVVSIVASERAVGRISCRNWAQAAGFPSKFVILNYFDSGSCLAQAPNGRWVSNTKVVQFIQATSTPAK